MTKIRLYTWTYCPFCIKAKRLLDEREIPYMEIAIDGDNAKKQELYKETGQSTVPFIFIDKKFLGGSTDLEKYINNGKLEEMLHDASS